MPPSRFPRLVSLACHDLRTPLATVYGFARTLTRDAQLDERSRRFVGMIEQASEQMTQLLDELGTAARIEAARWEPSLRSVDTLELATSEHDRVEAHGAGETIETDADAVGHGLESLALAALRHGPAERVTWDVRGRQLALAPVQPTAGPVVTGDEPRDLGSLVARMVIEELGGSLTLEGDTLLVSL
jgi:signal transduction histidine kinase